MFYIWPRTILFTRVKKSIPFTRVLKSIYLHASITNYILTTRNEMHGNQWINKPMENIQR